MDIGIIEIRHAPQFFALRRPECDWPAAGRPAGRPYGDMLTYLIHVLCYQDMEYLSTICHTAFSYLRMRIPPKPDDSSIYYQLKIYFMLPRNMYGETWGILSDFYPIDSSEKLDYCLLQNGQAISRFMISLRKCELRYTRLLFWGLCI
jgi:hypothetical protein